jgi:hypothetical protein
VAAVKDAGERLEAELAEAYERWAALEERGQGTG